MRALSMLLFVTTMFFGTRVSDPYRWLENAGSARTQHWIDVQNARAEKVVDAYAGRARVAAAVARLAVTGPRRFSPQLRGETMFYLQETPPQPQAVLIAQRWPKGRPRVVVDPSRFGAATSIEEVWPSPSGRYVAIGTANAGNESTTIRVLDLHGERWLHETLGPAGGGTTSPALAWDADERGFTYTRLPSNGSQFGVKLYHHVIGNASKRDTLALGALSPIAEYELLTSQNAHRAAALVHFGDGSFDRVYVRSGTMWEPSVGPQAGIVAGTYVGGRLLVVATGGTLRGRIAAVRRDGTLSTVVGQAPRWAYHQIAPIRGGFLVVKSWGTVWRVDDYDDAGRFVRTVALPQSGIGIDAIASESNESKALIAYEGWAGPADRWVTYDADGGALQTVYEVEPPSSDYANVRVHEIVAVSKDGTHVPVTVLSLVGTRADGKAPAVLTGYGGFDISIAPFFIGSQLAWLQMGGVLAVANLRGGSEYGEAWHRAGMLTHKQNVFDDFYASARTLVAAHWTTPQRLGIEGGSNGGLLVGAALVEHPQEYRAVVGEAGIYDALRHHVFPNGAYNVTEYGSVTDPAQFRALYAYSPYHHVVKGTRYPAVLLVTSENDPRVAPWQSWKFAAALQNATAARLPVVVLTHRTGGHGIGASFAQRVGNEALAMSFLAAQLGVRAKR